MQFDTLIIGGGLSGLVCGLALQEAGQRTAIVSAGQNALHFSSGTFGLLSSLPDGTPVSAPLEAVDRLDPGHPYREMGLSRFRSLAADTPAFFARCGVNLQGSADRNHFVVGAAGLPKPAWLSAEDALPLTGPDALAEHSILIVSFSGFLDFNTPFLEEGLGRHGARCRTVSVGVRGLEPLQGSPSGMRSIHIARILDQPRNRRDLCDGINGKLKDEDTVLLPAVFGLDDPEALQSIRDALPVRTGFVATMPPSIPGMRIQNALKQEYIRRKGTFLEGDEAVRAETDGPLLRTLHTARLGSTPLRGENYVLATGSFFSKGLRSTPDTVYEPLLGADLDFAPGRQNWFDEDFFGPHPYLSFGVRTDDRFRPLVGGEPLENVYAIGSVLGGADTLHTGSGAGIAILSARAVAGNIING